MRRSIVVHSVPEVLLIGILSIVHGQFTDTPTTNAHVTNSSRVSALYVLGDSSVDCGDNTLFYPLLHGRLSLYPCNGSDATLLPQLLGTSLYLFSSSFGLCIRDSSKLDRTTEIPHAGSYNLEPLHSCQDKRKLSFSDSYKFCQYHGEWKHISFCFFCTMWSELMYYDSCPFIWAIYPIISCLSDIRHTCTIFFCKFFAGKLDGYKSAVISAETFQYWLMMSITNVKTGSPRFNTNWRNGMIVLQLRRLDWPQSGHFMDKMDLWRRFLVVSTLGQHKLQSWTREATAISLLTNNYAKFLRLCSCCNCNWMRTLLSNL